VVLVILLSGFYCTVNRVLVDVEGYDIRAKCTRALYIVYTCTCTWYIRVPCSSTRTKLYSARVFNTAHYFTVLIQDRGKGVNVLLKLTPTDKDILFFLGCGISSTPFFHFFSQA